MIIFFIILVGMYFLLIRCMICRKVNINMYYMAIKDIPNYYWYSNWNVTDWIMNPLRYNLWTAKSTRKYLQENRKGA